jgi:AcrR family transcriptional regulator
VQLSDGDRSDPEHAWRSAPPIPLTPLLEAAMNAFVENSYHGTSVREIAGRVGITVPALYYHHENKEAILFALLDSSIDRLRSLCDEAVADAEGTAGDSYFNLVECMARYMTRSGKIAFLDAEIRSLSPDNRKTYVEKRREIENLLLQTIEDGIRAGLFRLAYPADTARALLGMIQAIATWYRPDGPLGSEDVAGRYVAIAANMVGAGSEPATAPNKGRR